MAVWIPNYDLFLFSFCIGCWESEEESISTKKSVCADDTLQGDRRCGLESPQLGTSSEYGFLTSRVTAPVIKELYKRGCSSWGFTRVLEKETVSFTQVLERVFADAYWVVKLDLHLIHWIVLNPLWGVYLAIVSEGPKDKHFDLGFSNP